MERLSELIKAFYKNCAQNKQLRKRRQDHGTKMIDFRHKQPQHSLLSVNSFHTDRRTLKLFITVGNGAFSLLKLVIKLTPAHNV